MNRDEWRRSDPDILCRRCGHRLGAHSELVEKNPCNYHGEVWEVQPQCDCLGFLKPSRFVCASCGHDWEEHQPVADPISTACEHMSFVPDGIQIINRDTGEPVSQMRCTCAHYEPRIK